jgi:hypothetical protein
MSPATAVTLRPVAYAWARNREGRWRHHVGVEVQVESADRGYLRTAARVVGADGMAFSSIPML